MFYENANEEDETTRNSIGFIDTDGILNDVMSESILPEISEVNLTEDNSMNEGKDEMPESHECQGVDDPKRGGKTSNKTRKKLDAESENIPLKDGSEEAFRMPNTNEELLDEKRKLSCSTKISRRPAS